jgi:MHS family proline/betaine transporter-like MFS transporter
VRTATAPLTHPSWSCRYDFSLFAYLTPILSPLFFPSEDPSLSVLATYGVFAVGLIARPIGGLFFGRQGDTSGRKAALLSTLLCMSLPLLVLTALPTYETIGVAAPILFTLCRLVMGFAVGGELSASVVTLIETSSDSQRGLYANLALGTAGLGTVVAAAVNFALQQWMEPEPRMLYGWRIAFGVGFVLSLLCLTMRKQLHESPSYEKLVLAKTAAAEKNPEPVSGSEVEKPSSCMNPKTFFAPLISLRPHWRDVLRSALVALG